MFKFRKCLNSFILDEYDNLNDLLRDKSTINTVDSMESIQAIQIVIPKLIDNLPIDLSSISTLNYFLDGEYNKHDDSLKYILIKNTPIHFILHPYFLENYLQNGQLQIQTSNQLNELDDYLTLLPDGKLFLCVNQTTYTSLGLVCKLAQGYKNNFNLKKYIIELNLKDKLMNDFNSKHYQRTFKSIKNINLKLDLVLKWLPDNNQISSISLIRFFQMLKYQQFNNDNFFNEIDFNNIEIYQCGPNVRKFELDNYLMPILDNDDSNIKDVNEFKYSKQNQLIDSIGLALTGSYLPEEQDEDDEVNTFRLDKFKLTNLICLEITGLFNINNIRIILSELFELIKLNTKLEYCVLIVNGFENTIRSWHGQSNLHLKQLSGENLYGLFLSRSLKNLVWRAGDEKDYGIERL